MANIVIGLMKKHGVPPEPEDDDGEAGKDGSEGDGGDYQEAAADVLDAVQSKDTGALADALKNFFYMCDSEPHEEGSHEDEG